LNWRLERQYVLVANARISWIFVDSKIENGQFIFCLKCETPSRTDGISGVVLKCRGNYLAKETELHEPWSSMGNCGWGVGLVIFRYLILEVLLIVNPLPIHPLHKAFYKSLKATTNTEEYLQRSYPEN